MATRQSLKKYQKQKFENYKKINELNVSDDEAYIPIRVNSMDDIISNYSVRNNEMLSEEFINIRDRIIKVLPQSSIFGLIFEQECEYEVINIIKLND